MRILQRGVIVTVFDTEYQTFTLYQEEPLRKGNTPLQIWRDNEFKSPEDISTIKKTHVFCHLASLER